MTFDRLCSCQTFKCFVPHSNTTLSTVLLSEEVSCECDYRPNLIRYFRQTCSALNMVYIKQFNLKYFSQVCWYSVGYTSANFLSRVFALISLTFAPFAIQVFENFRGSTARPPFRRPPRFAQRPAILSLENVSLG